jgi:hypothetical protein
VRHGRLPSSVYTRIGNTEFQRFRRNFCSSGQRCLIGAPRFPILYHPQMPDWLQQWLNQNAPWLYPLAVVVTILGGAKPTRGRPSFKMPCNIQRTIAKAVSKKPEEVVGTIKIINPGRLAGAWTVSFNGALTRQTVADFAKRCCIFIPGSHKN